jgi:hypothetical protein
MRRLSRDDKIAYHRRLAAYLRAVAANTTVPSLKLRLLQEADEHELVLEQLTELA